MVSPVSAVRPIGEWQPTACVLCACNCGIEVQVAEGNLARIKGDKAHPGSQGYACEKAQRLAYYQSNPRILAPMRRRPDGSYEEVDWDVAIAEVAAGLAGVRDAHGGASIFYYGGGGQGNHLGGVYARALRSALGMRFASNALAQEKTGEFWIDAHLFGHVTHTTPDFERAQVAVFVGKNPWMAHGFSHARPTLKAVAGDPDRTLIVIDPRRSETAAMADIHLQVRPGGDAFLLAALLAVLVQEDLLDHVFLDERTENADEVIGAVRDVDVAEYARRAGIGVELVRTAARRIGNASSVSILEDLGIQQAPHSTLNSYLEKLLWALTGNFARPGCTNLHTQFAPGGLVGRSRESRRRTPGTGERVIGGMFPAASIPEAVLSDDPARFRGAIIESSNPVHSLPDSPRMRETMAALHFSVVIDITMTETASCASYVLPALTQYEKYECTFFNFEFPRNVFHLRAPVLPSPDGPLAEPEIHRRLVRALGALTDEDLGGLDAAAKQGLDVYAAAFAERMTARPHLTGLAPIVLYETLGPALPDGARAAAALWGMAQMCAAGYSDSVRRAGFEGDGVALGNALFEAVLRERRGFVFSADDHEVNWEWIRRARPSGRIDLAISELLEELVSLEDEHETVDPDFPFVLSAGERRTNTAMTLIRDPAWRKRDPLGALRMSPQDARALELIDGELVTLTTRRGSCTTPVEITETMRAGHVSLPNGYGLTYGADGPVTGVATNELTESSRRDPIAGTPWHKNVPARIVRASS
ncbi:MAG: molybdopterin-dependent oxidoreductase [Solirubrobacterales bacterium]|nr:molybdopterin-dependent oxidoreductase [Solirubrobacterales bacterium]